MPRRRKANLRGFRVGDERNLTPSLERERASVAFTSAWMLRPSAEGYLVKVALIGCVAAPGFRLAARSDALGATEDVWLGAISENLLGFVGVGVAGLETPAGQFVGKTIPFTRADVRDWRECASTAAVINWANRVRGDAATAATKKSQCRLDGAGAQFDGNTTRGDNAGDRGPQPPG